LKGIPRGLTENKASTNPVSQDARLLGRTYAIPFQQVWTAACQLAGGGLRGWSLLSADDQRGVIEATTKAFFLRTEDDIRVEVGLDENAQTRVDVLSMSRRHRGDLGRNRRNIGRFLRKLDRRLAAGPDKILDVTRTPAWLQGE